MKISKKVIVMLLVVMSLCSYFTIIASAAQPVTDGNYVIVSALDNNKVIDISNASTDNCANVQLWTKNGTGAQDFKLTYNSAGYYTITNANSGKALDVANGTAALGTNVWQYECNNTKAQQWYLEDAGNGYYYIKSALGFYLDVNEACTNDGTNIKIWEHNNSNAQKFKFIPRQSVANGNYVIVSALDNNKVIDISNASTDNCANVQLWIKNGTGAQDFKLTYNSAGYYTITNANSGKVLDVAGGTAAAGTNVWQYDYNNTKAQQWYLEDAGNGYYYIKSALGFYLDVNEASTNDGTNIKVWEYNGSNAQKFKFIAKSSAISNNNNSAVQDRLDAIANGTLKYNDTTYMKINSKFTGTRANEQCKGYAKNVFDMCFGITPGSTQSTAKGLNYLINSTNGMTKLGSVTNMTSANISSLFLKARSGDFVQMRRSHGGSHSAIVYNVTSNGVTFLEANLDSKNTVYLKTYTWSQLCSSNAAMSVYTATNYCLK